MPPQYQCILDRNDTNGVRKTTQALQCDRKILIHFSDAKTTLWINMISIFKNLNSEFSNSYILFSESI